MPTTFSLTATTGPDGWTIEHTTTALVTTTKTIPAARSAASVLRTAERMASGDVLWMVTDGGFSAVIHSEVTGWPL